MRIVLATIRLQFLELARLPTFTLPLAIFPAVLYLAVGVGIEEGRRLVLLGFVAFAILGSMMFQFGVGIAASRDTPWSVYTLTLPSTASQRAVSLLGVGATFATLFCVPLLVIGAIAGVPGPTSLGQLGLVVVALLLGAVVHGLFGIVLGYWLPARGAAGITNILYFPLSFVGGMFGPIADPTLAAIRPWTPTGAWMGTLWAADGERVDVLGLSVLAAFGVLFAVVALLGHRRVERTVYG